MALVMCPACRKKKSSLALVCPNCGFSNQKDVSANDEQLALTKKRKFRDRIYHLKMISYVAMSLAMVGIIPMLWSYIEAIENSVKINLKEHWGLYFVGIGFLIYVITRYLMIKAKKEYRN